MSDSKCIDSGIPYEGQISSTRTDRAENNAQQLKDSEVLSGSDGYESESESSGTPPTLQIRRDIEQAQRERTRRKLDRNFGPWAYYFQCMCCRKTQPCDPSMGALPREWLDPDRKNFRTRDLEGHRSQKWSDGDRSEHGFSTTASSLPE